MHGQFLKMLKKNVPLSIASKIINLWPPYMGAGIRLEKMTNDARYAKVSMNLTLLNRNMVGTQFGGSLYAMTDPIYMWMLIENLGKHYIVWDKAAEIRFRSPGRSKVYAEFELSANQIDEIRAKADSEEKYEPQFTVQVKDESGKIIATVVKTVHVRRKDRVTSKP